MIDIDVMDNLGLKIAKYNSIAKCISIIKKYRKDPISEIKTAIETNDFVLACDYIDDKGLMEMINCYDELISNNCMVEIYDLGRIGSREMLCNLHESHLITQIETFASVEAELDDEG